MIRHVVFVRFRKDVPPQEIEAILRQLQDLCAVLPGMTHFAGGPNVNPEGLDQGFTHAFSCDFVDAAARDAYLVHPAHRAAGARLVAATDGGREGLAVIDFSGT
ncbi:Dabb family protein [Aquabacter sp. CN5-332]|uniref:Dabb family protein n=1 Tax=Aquabacter sp. CN5-332 TaxID=3156608 RepID=UPI0032B50D09